MPTHPGSQKVDKQQKLLTLSPYFLLHQAHSEHFSGSIHRAAAKEKSLEFLRNRAPQNSYL